MVTLIIPLPRLATKHALLLLRLDALSPRRDPPARDSIADETVVVAAPVKRDEGVVQIVGFVPKETIDKTITKVIA